MRKTQSHRIFIAASVTLLLAACSAPQGSVLDIPSDAWEEASSSSVDTTGGFYLEFDDTEGSNEEVQLYVGSGAGFSE